LERTFAFDRLYHARLVRGAATTAAPPQAPAATEAPAATKALPQLRPRSSSCPDSHSPIPYPDPAKLEVGGGTVNRLPIDKIVTYKALPEYKQPAWMDKLVADGSSRPLKTACPKNRKSI